MFNTQNPLSKIQVFILREAIARYRAEIERWNLSSEAWWLIDLRDAPDQLVCGVETADLFDLDTSQPSHSLSRIVSTAIENPFPLIGENPQQICFFDNENLSSDDTPTSFTFKHYNPSTGGDQLYSNQIRVVERCSKGVPQILYGVIEQVTASSACTFDALFDEQFDAMVGDYGFGYSWVVDLDNMLIKPDRAMAQLHGMGWVAGQWYPFKGIYDWTPEEYWSQVKSDTDQFRSRIRAGGGAELNVTHPHVHAQTGELHWYNIRGKHLPLHGRNFSIGFAVDVTQAYEQKELLLEQYTREDLLTNHGEIAQWEYDVETGTLKYDELYCQWLNTGLQPDEPCDMGQVMSTMTQEQQKSFLEDVQAGMDLLLDKRASDEYVWDHCVWDRIVRAIAKRTELGGREVVLGYSIDVTDVVRARNRAIHLHERLQDLAETAHIGVFDHKLGSGVFECNEAFREIYSLPIEQYPQIRTQDIESRWDREHAKSYRAVLTAAFRGEKFLTHERILRLPDGSVRHVTVSINGVYSGETLERISGSVVDHTQDLLKQAQLEEMLCEREDMLQRQQKMFAIIGHELRTPVAAVRMLIEDDQMETQEKLEQLGDISEGLLNVIDDLRLVSNPVDKQQSDWKIEDPERVIKSATASLKKLLHDRAIKIHIEIESSPLKLRIPAQSLRQAVTNLVKNAALHSEGENIYVRLSYSQALGSGLLATLSVEDDGRGIAPEKRKRLFEAFERGDSQQDGSGLGLYIVRTLATKMEGAISCTPSRYGGACFALSFPVGRAVLVESKLAAEAELSLDGMRILLAEDEATLRLLTDRMLSKRGAEVTACEDGAAALETFKQGSYDLLLTDMMMPRLDGVGLTEAVREIAPDFPIIAVTAAVMGSESDKLKVAGVNAVVAKPITATVLQKTLHELALG